MALELKIPSLDSSDAAKNIKETILTSEPDARVDVNLEQKIVMVEAKASEETIRQLVTAAGYKIAS